MERQDAVTTRGRRLGRRGAAPALALSFALSIALSVSACATSDPGGPAAAGPGTRAASSTPTTTEGHTTTASRTASPSPSRVAAAGGAGENPALLPPEQGFVDVAYLFHPLPAQFAVLAGRHAWFVDVGKLRSSADAKNVAHELLRQL